MCPQGINDDRSAELVEVVAANHDIPGFWQGQIDTALEVEQSIQCARVIQHPRHVRDEACCGKTSSSSIVQKCRQQREHRAFVKAAPAQRRLVPPDYLQLSLVLRSSGRDYTIDCSLGGPAMWASIVNVKGPIPLLHSFADER